MPPANSSSPSDTRRQRLIAFAMLMAVVFILYAGSFGHDWTMDDFPVIVHNPDVTSWSAFLADSYPGRPLRELTYLLDHALFGLNPAGYHIQNIFWHGLNAFLVLMLVRRLGAGWALAWSVSLLFALHPIQVEVVANISHRKGSLALAFCLLALLAYIRGLSHQRRRYPWLLLAAGLGAIALLAKQNALVLPLVFLAYEMAVVPSERRFLLRFPRLAALGIGLAGAGVLGWIVSLGGPQAFKGSMRLALLLHANHFPEPGFSTWYAMILKSWAFLLMKFLLPVELAVEYFIPVPKGWLDPWVVAALAMVPVYLLSLWWTYRKDRLAFFALCWAGIFFLPTSNLLPTSYFAADRYLYPTSVGLLLLLTRLVWRPQRIKGTAKALATAALCVALAGLSWQQVRIWTSNFSLYSRAAEVSPQAVFALNNLGWAYYERNDIINALRLLERAEQVNSYFPVTYYNLATIYERQGLPDKALRYYRHALQAAPYLPVFEPTAHSIRQTLVNRYGQRPDSLP